MALAIAFFKVIEILTKNRMSLHMYLRAGISCDNLFIACHLLTKRFLFQWDTFLSNWKNPYYGNAIVCYAMTGDCSNVISCLIIIPFSEKEYDLDIIYVVIYLCSWMNPWHVVFLNRKWIANWEMQCFHLCSIISCILIFISYLHHPSVCCAVFLVSKRTR